MYKRVNTQERNIQPKLGRHTEGTKLRVKRSHGNLCRHYIHPLDCVGASQQRGCLTRQGRLRVDNVRWEITC